MTKFVAMHVSIYLQGEVLDLVDHQDHLVVKSSRFHLDLGLGKSHYNPDNLDRNLHYLKK